MNVKKYIKYTCVGLLLVYTMTSCEKLLNEDPRYSINNVKAFESEATADMALEGCYGYMSTYLTYGQSIAELYVGASGIAWAQTNNNDQDQYNSFDILATNGVVDMVWSGLYKVIGQCNFFIAGVEASSLRDEYKKNAIANAKFLRGLCYYQLASSFGGVPLRLDPTQSSTLSVARAKREDVYALVEQDLKAATEGLKTKEQLGNAADGKATKYAAYALLAKLYYTLASHENNPSSVYWAKAKEAGDIVLANGNYRLEPKFKNLFVNHVAGSPESIFQINFSTSSPSDGNRASWLFSPPNSTNGVSWGRIRSSKAFYDFFRGSYPDDPRLSVTFATEWTQAKTNNQRLFSYPYLRKNIGTPAAPVFVAGDSINYSKSSDPTNPKLSDLSANMIKAFVEKAGDHQGWPYFVKQMDVNVISQNSNKNVIVYRYADFLLLMADVENELGNKTKSLDLLNQVLTRARTSSSKVSVHPRNVAASVTQEELRTKIFYERLFELAGEYENFNDTRRRGVGYLRLIVTRHNTHHITKAFVDYAKANNNITNFRERLLPSDELGLKKNLLLPIPQSEINTNEALSESDQNFGY